MQVKNQVVLAKIYGWGQAVSLKDLESNALDPWKIPHAFAYRGCGTADAPDQELAESEDWERLACCLGCSNEDARCINLVHKSMWEMETGSGSFPVGCHPSVDDSRHVVAYYIDWDSFPDHYKYPVDQDDIDDLVKANVWGTREELQDKYLGKPMLEATLRLMEETYRRVGVLLFRTEDRSKAQVHIRSRNIRGSTIGIGWFNNGTCHQVEFHIDSTWRPDLSRNNLLFNHEIGHCHRLYHEFRRQSVHHGVMSYDWPRYTYGFSRGKEIQATLYLPERFAHTLPEDPSIRDLREYFGDEEYPLEKPPEPPSTPPSGIPFELPGSLKCTGVVMGSIILPAGLNIKRGVEYIPWKVGGVYKLRQHPIV